jgi:phasin family protein
MPKDNETNGHDNAFHFAGLTNGIPGLPSLPGMDAVMQVQRRNAEVFAQAGQQIFQGFQELMQRQSEMMREGMSQSSQLMGAMMQPGAPQEKMAGQAEIAKQAMEKVAANGKELFEMATACQMRAAEMVASRMGEAFEEFRTACASARK